YWTYLADSDNAARRRARRSGPTKIGRTGPSRRGDQDAHEPAGRAQRPVSVVDVGEQWWQPFDRARQETGPHVFRGVAHRLLDRTPCPGRGGQALCPVLFVLARKPPACLIVVDQGAGLALQQRPAPVVGDVKVSP
ncbi:hypothetical protein ACWGBX_37415, partial [Streptomyces sp. NPDC055037]